MEKVKSDEDYMYRVNTNGESRNDGRKIPERECESEWEWDVLEVESGLDSWGMVQP